MAKDKVQMVSIRTGKSETVSVETWEKAKAIFPGKFKVLSSDEKPLTGEAEKIKAEAKAKAEADKKAKSDPS